MARIKATAGVKGKRTWSAAKRHSEDQEAFAGLGVTLRSDDTAAERLAAAINDALNGVGPAYRAVPRQTTAAKMASDEGRMVLDAKLRRLGDVVRHARQTLLGLR